MRPRHATPGDPDADELLDTDPLALLIRMMLDQHMPERRADTFPADTSDRRRALVLAVH